MKLREQQNVGYRFVDNVHRSEKAPMLLRVVPVSPANAPGVGERSEHTTTTPITEIPF